MKIVFTGGGSGGHFFPIIAVVQALYEVVEKEKLLDPELYFLAPEPYDKKELFEKEIEFRRIPAGKIRNYFSIRNFTDLFITGIGVVKALVTLYSIYPDVIFSKGGYGSFPTLLAARLLAVPVVLHESDSIPGKVNKWAGKFAKRVALSFPQAAQYFPKNSIAYTGNPIRRELKNPTKEGARAYLKLEDGIPTILILGGSQGAERINQTVLDALLRLVEHYQIIHQVGEKNKKEVESVANVVLEGSQYSSRYHPFGFLDTLALRMAAGIADVVVTRAGSTLFEIAVWNVPAIVIPITISSGDHQRKNAYEYSRAGAGIVIEEDNLSDDVLEAQIYDIVTHEEKRRAMGGAGKNFAPQDGAEKIARELLYIALEHESR